MLTMPRPNADYFSGYVDHCIYNASNARLALTQCTLEAKGFSSRMKDAADKAVLVLFCYRDSCISFTKMTHHAFHPPKEHLSSNVGSRNRSSHSRTHKSSSRNYQESIMARRCFSGFNKQDHHSFMLESVCRSPLVLAPLLLVVSTVNKQWQR